MSKPVQSTMSSVHLLLCLPLDLLPLIYSCTMSFSRQLGFLMSHDMSIVSGFPFYILFSNCLSPLSFSSVQSLVFLLHPGIQKLIEVAQCILTTCCYVEREKKQKMKHTKKTWKTCSGANTHAKWSVSSLYIRSTRVYFIVLND